MSDLNLAAIVVAALASFVASGVWYAVLGNTMVRLQGEWRGAAAPERPQAWRMAAFLGVAVVVAACVAVLVNMTGVTGVVASAGLGLLLWVGFCATQWIGSILGEDVPLKLAAIHAGDWLAHLLIMSVILGVWR